MTSNQFAIFKSKKVLNLMSFSNQQKDYLHYDIIFNVCQLGSKTLFLRKELKSGHWVSGENVGFVNMTTFKPGLHLYSSLTSN